MWQNDYKLARGGCINLTCVFALKGQFCVVYCYTGRNMLHLLRVTVFYFRCFFVVVVFIIIVSFQICIYCLHRCSKCFQIRTRYWMLAHVMFRAYFVFCTNRRLMYIHDVAYVVDVNECKTMVAFEVPRWRMLVNVKLTLPSWWAMFAESVLCVKQWSCLFSRRT